jgi:hypothetical protein
VNNLCLSVLAAHLSAAVTVGGIVGDPTNILDRSVVYRTLCDDVFMLCAVNCVVGRCAFDGLVLSCYCVMQLVK